MGADDRQVVKDLSSADPRQALADGRSIPMGDPEETTTWERARERGVTEEQWARFEDAVAEMFGAFGMDLGTQGTEATPRRFVRALFEATAGYEGDPKLLDRLPHGMPRRRRIARSARSSKDPSRSSLCASITRSRSTASRTSATWRTSRSSGSPR